MGDKSRGNLIIIGGAEDKDNECDILKEVARLCGQGTLTLMTTATLKPEETAKKYTKVFERLGVRSISALNIMSRQDSDNPAYVETLKSSEVIFFTGGDQLRITSILGGTVINGTLKELYNSGTLIVGTSAGASVMSSTMIVQGSDNIPAKKCTLKMAAGLGLMEEAIIDQHFDQRGRIGRLLCGVAMNPYMLGIGIDEDTAIRVYPGDYFTVLGTNSVTILDGRSIENSNVSELKPDELLAISNMIMHVIPKGYKFDMKDRKVYTE